MQQTLRNEEGYALLLVMIIGTLMISLSFYLSGRSANFKNDVSKITSKTEAINDRNLIQYDLRTRAFPPP